MSSAHLRASILGLTLFATPALGQTPPPPREPFGVIDNSFFIEEGLNQDPGTFQNIFTFRRGRRSWEAAFTQEWPLVTIAHQFSYTVPFDAAGLGGVMANYRFQALSEGTRVPAFAPRLSAILPARGSDPGLQMALPFSKRAGDFYFHWNAGMTQTHRPASTGQGAEDRRPALTDRWVGGSAIWRLSPTANLMFETLVESIEEPAAGETSRHREILLSPGFRKGWKRGDREFVLGLAAPVSLQNSEKTFSALVYLSYELPYRK